MSGRGTPGNTLLAWICCRLGWHHLEERFYRMPANDIRRTAGDDDA